MNEACTDLPFAEPAPRLAGWIASALPGGVRRYLVDVGGHRLHVMEWGRGKLPVLLLHGNPTWGFLWRKVVSYLDLSAFRVIVPDLMGLGWSDRVASSAHTLSNHASWIGKLIDIMDLPPLIFCGQDWGGPIGLAALAERGDRAAGLVILNTVTGPPRPGFRPTAFHRFARRPIVSTAAFRLAGFPQISLHAAQGDPSTIRGRVRAAYVWPLANPLRNAAPLALARMVPDDPEHPSVPLLERVEAFAGGFDGPAAIVWGQRDPVLGRALKRVSATVAGATVDVTDAGHFLQEEVPDRIARAIARVGHRHG